MGHNASCCRLNYCITYWDTAAGGVLSAAPSSTGPLVTLQFQLKEGGHAPKKIGVRMLLCLRHGFFLASSKCFNQLHVPCHERSAARQLNQTLHRWLSLRVLYSASAIRPSKCKGFFFFLLQWLYTDTVLQANSAIHRPLSFITAFNDWMPLDNNLLCKNDKIKGLLEILYSVGRGFRNKTELCSVIWALLQMQDWVWLVSYYAKVRWAYVTL